MLRETYFSRSPQAPTPASTIFGPGFGIQDMFL